MGKQGYDELERRKETLVFDWVLETKTTNCSIQTFSDQALVVADVEGKVKEILVSDSPMLINESISFQQEETELLSGELLELRVGHESTFVQFFQVVIC